MNREQTYALLKWAYQHFTDTKVYNEHVVPEEGPVILTLNHLSYIDFPTISSIKRLYDVTALAGDSYKEHKLFGKIMDNAGVIWIDRTQADFTAMKAALDVLKRGKILFLSPEGTRSKSAQLLKAKNGVVLLASKMNAPICTVSIAGTETYLEDFKHFRKPRVTVHFGPAFHLPAIDRENRDASLENAANEVMCRIAAMLPESYRGYYRDFPRVRELREEWRQDSSLVIPED